MIFRGSIPHHMQSLCTLRNPCRQWPRNTRYQADATPYLGRTCTGWIAPAFGWRTYSITSSARADRFGTVKPSAYGSTLGREIASLQIRRLLASPTTSTSATLHHCAPTPVRCRRVGEAGIAKDMPNKSFGRIAELNVGPDRRRLATTDNWWETVLWLTPSIIKS